MYKSYYALKEKPDVLTPDPGFLYLSTRHKAALSVLERGVMNQAGLVVISGEVGSGKTILIRQFHNVQPGPHQCTLRQSIPQIRHAITLKIWWPQIRGGSSSPTRTNYFNAH